MRVLVGCEFSGIVRDAFIRAGHDAVSCDLLPTEMPGPHIQTDVLGLLDDGWDLAVFHPPCTYLANSGVRWLHYENGKRNAWRWNELVKGGEFFKALKDCRIPRICIENPIPHKYAREYTGKYTQIIQPWQFGHGETKAICLWLKNLPPLRPTKIVDGRVPRVHYASPGPDRWKERSRFFAGVAEAMATQWSEL